MREKQNSSMENWELDRFCPTDALGIVELYRAVYGDDHPVKSVYDPEEIIRQSQTGDSYRVVARTESGQVIGTSAFFRSSSPNRELYEYGQLMVRRDYRGNGIGIQLDEYAIKTIPTLYVMETIWGEIVCNIVASQKSEFVHGFCETGLEVDLMPGQAYDNFSNCAKRVSTLLAFRTYKARPQIIYVPPMYEQELAFLYTGCEYGHTFRLGNAALPPNRATVGKCDLFSGAGIARFTFDDIGSDFVTYFDNMERETKTGEAVVKQVFFRLTCPWTGAIVDILRKRGYFIGGYLPRWFDDDGFLMQKIEGDPNFEGIKLYSQRAKQIMELIKKDWQEVSVLSE